MIGENHVGASMVKFLQKLFASFHAPGVAGQTAFFSRYRWVSRGFFTERNRGNSKVIKYQCEKRDRRLKGLRSKETRRIIGSYRIDERSRPGAIQEIRDNSPIVGVREAAGAFDDVGAVRPAGDRRLKK